MSRNGSGTFTTINTFTPSTTAVSSDVNENFDDLGDEITNSLALDGQSTMTGQLKAANGTKTAPGISFGSDGDTGIYRIGSNNIGVSCGDTKILDISSTGLDVIGVVSQGGFRLIPAGTVASYAGASLPDGWLLCYGQLVSRATYAALFTALGTTYSAGDGSTFGLPDLRGRAIFGKDDMGGSAASRVTTAGSSVDGATLGAGGGAQNRTVAQANLPVVTLTTSIAAGQGSHPHTINATANKGDLPSGSTVLSNEGATVTAQSGALPAMSGTTPLGGSATALATMNPALVLNYIIKI